MNTIDREDFIKNFNDARGYHLRALQFAGENQRPSLIFNISSVAVERYLIALCASFGIMPFNHSFICLTDSLDPVAGIDPLLIRKIRTLDAIFGICSVDDYYHKIPEKGEELKALNICNKLYSIILSLPAVLEDETIKEKCFNNNVIE